MSTTRRDSSARERAIRDYDRREDSPGLSPSEAISDSPLIALGGGIALGALIAALLPVGRRERELVAPLADRVKDSASAAVSAAREAGETRLGELGLTRDRGNDAIKSIVDGAADALRTSARAAVGSVRGER